MLEYQGGDGRVFLGRRLYFLARPTPNSST